MKTDAAALVQELRRVAEDRRDTAVLEIADRLEAAISPTEGRLSPREAADRLGLRSENTVKNWIKRGILKGYRMANSYIVIPREEVDRLTQLEYAFPRDEDDLTDDDLLRAEQVSRPRPRWSAAVSAHWIAASGHAGVKGQQRGPGLDDVTHEWSGRSSSSDEVGYVVDTLAAATAACGRSREPRTAVASLERIDRPARDPLRA